MKYKEKIRKEYKVDGKRKAKERRKYENEETIELKNEQTKVNRTVEQTNERTN